MNNTTFKVKNVIIKKKKKNAKPLIDWQTDWVRKWVSEGQTYLIYGGAGFAVLDLDLVKTKT